MSESEHQEWRRAHRSAASDVGARLAEAERLLDACCAGSDPWLDGTPRPGGWSRRAILEHVCLVNHFLLVLARKIADRSRARLARGEPWPTAPPRHGAILRLAHRTEPWPSPEHMVPTGTADLGEVRGRLAAQFTEARRLVAEMPAGEGTLHRIRMSRIPGEDRLGLVEYLDVLARHAERHLDALGPPPDQGSAR